jgi:hypothetical protein
LNHLNAKLDNYKSYFSIENSRNINNDHNYANHFKNLEGKDFSVVESRAEIMKHLNQAYILEESFDYKENLNVYKSDIFYRILALYSEVCKVNDYLITLPMEDFPSESAGPPEPI